MHDKPIDSPAAFEIDPDALKAVDFMQARLFLDAIIGKTIASTATERDRTTISTTDGTTLVFCAFAGSDALQATK